MGSPMAIPASQRIPQPPQTFVAIKKLVFFMPIVEPLVPLYVWMVFLWRLGLLAPSTEEGEEWSKEAANPLSSF
ncbi:hypothetical protein TIFTF001_034938 [Ficus carica]|uniref:Uncharacterized protein n=1 Tax=Ficus carica TaxID=3494 RepID=A0AA88J9A0_FICCA|nr:hypothetical protein TIFTF001_034938 [Ficus carica]